MTVDFEKIRWKFHTDLQRSKFFSLNRFQWTPKEIKGMRTPFIQETSAYHYNRSLRMVALFKFQPNWEISPSKWATRWTIGQVKTTVDFENTRQNKNLAHSMIKGTRKVFRKRPSKISHRSSEFEHFFRWIDFIDRRRDKNNEHLLWGPLMKVNWQSLIIEVTVYLSCSHSCGKSVQ